MTYQNEIPEMEQQATEIRRFILQNVAEHGGHLASNLGVVELTMALHRIFSVNDGSEPLFFDVGHQSYTHKILSSRREKFASLRQLDGLSGFANPAESPADPVISGHTGSALSVALGVAAARRKSGDNRKVIAFLGDASLNNGPTLEALNSASRDGENLLIILNDNQMSISPNVGGMAAMLNRIISHPGYNHLREEVKNLTRPHLGLFNRLKKFNDMLKGWFLPPGSFFEALGIRYFGPVDGHDFAQLLPLLSRLKQLRGPLLLHAVTVKGRGFAPAEQFPEKFHGVGSFDLNNANQLPEKKTGFSHAFGETMLELAEKDEKLLVVSPAMIAGTGLAEFRRRYPERTYDVGIAEEHCVSFAAGLAKSGLHPVVAGYAGFMTRSFDQFYHDVILNKLDMVIMLDRSGAVEDGPTHHGIYDLGFLRELPGCTVAMPATENELNAMLKLALKSGGLWFIRYPKGNGAALPAEKVERGAAQLICEPEKTAPVIWAAGTRVVAALKSAEIYQKKYGIRPGVINARFIAPVDAVMEERFAGRCALVLEDHCAKGGLFSALAELRAARGEAAPLLSGGWPAEQIVLHGKPEDLAGKYLPSFEELADKLFLAATSNSPENRGML